jgi:Cdc6-like AAA superfamily ATPase
MLFLALLSSIFTKIQLKEEKLIGRPFPDFLVPIFNTWHSVIFPELRKYPFYIEIKHIENNYIVGPPIRPGNHNLFVGRDLIFHRIFNLWENKFDKVSIILYGQRRMGKTSVLYYLEDRLNNSESEFNFITALLNLQELALVKSEGEFFYNLSRIIKHRIAKEGITIQLSEIQEFEKRSFTVFNEFLDEVMEKLDQNTFLVLMLDEFEEIEEKIKAGIFHEDILKEFRSIMQHKDKIFLILSGSHELDEMCREYWSPLFHVAEPVKIGYLSKNSAYQLITNPWENFMLDYDPKAVEKIMQITGNQPMLIQVVCRSIIDRMNEKKELGEIPPDAFPSPKIEDVEAVIEESLSGSYYFEAMWRDLSEDEQELLVKMALTDHAFTDSDRETVKALKRRELLTKDNTFRIPLLTNWIESNDRLQNRIQEHVKFEPQFVEDID